MHEQNVQMKLLTVLYSRRYQGCPRFCVKAYYEQDRVADASKTEVSCPNGNPTSSSQNEPGVVMDASQSAAANNIPHFQSLLFTFLDTQAPQLS